MTAEVVVRRARARGRRWSWNIRWVDEAGRGHRRGGWARTQLGATPAAVVAAWRTGR